MILTMVLSTLLGNLIGCFLALSYENYKALKKVKNNFFKYVA